MMNASQAGTMMPVVDSWILGSSIELTAVMGRVADLLKANAEALADGVVTTQERHQLALWAEVLAQAAHAFSKTVEGQ